MMDAAERWARIEALFDSVIELDPAARGAYLDRECPEPALREEVEALLASAAASEGFLAPGGEGPQPRLQAGTQVGDWRIGQLLGRGGMGEVYRADRVGKDFEQRGALKLLTRLDTEDSRQIFARERRILGALRHRGIAHLLDGGEYQGLPYAVMEYVAGEPLDTRARRSGLPQRVDLFLQVCEAVSHAHRHLVVHRDLKPGNILVSAEGEVKLLDFGIAKLLEAGPGGEVTQEVRLSPHYCAPEQFDGGPVSVATDVYALGVILYELLTGSRPWQDQGLGWMQTVRRLAVTEPPVPSQQVAGASRRRLRGDLDSIVLKAMQREPERRYASVDALAEDLRAWQQSRPVQARGGRLAYRLGRGLRRYRWLSALGFVALASLVGFVAVTWYFNQQIRNEKDLALSALTQAENTRNVLVRIMTEADPFGGSGAQTRLSDALLQAEDVIAKELGDQLASQAELYGVLADVWQGLGESQRAVTARQKQLEALHRVVSVNSLELFRARRQLLVAGATAENAQATLAGLEDLLISLRAGHPQARVEQAILARELGALHGAYGRFEDGLRHQRAAVALLDTEPVPDPLELATALIELGDSLDGLQDYEQAQQLTRRALRIREQQLGAAHPLTLNAQTDLAARLARADRAAESLAIYRQVIPLFEERLGPHHDHLLDVMQNMAFGVIASGDLEAAVELLRDILARQRQKTPLSELEIAQTLQNLGTVLARMHRYPEALEYLATAAQGFDRALLPGHVAKAYPHLTMARIHSEREDVDALEKHTRRAIELLDGNVHEQHPTWYTTRCLLGDVLLRRGQVEAGEELVRAGMAGLDSLAESRRHAAECEAILARNGRLGAEP